MSAALKDLPFHPLAEIFPSIYGKDFAALKLDIKDHGLHEPIVIYDGQILDGRNRYRACREIGVQPHFIDYTGDDPTGYVISLNLRRRHLDESQRAMVAAKLANMCSGARTDLAQIQARSQSEAAEMLNVSRTSVQSAKVVHSTGTPELITKVEQGQVSVSSASTIATLPPKEQVVIVAKGDKEIKVKAKEIKDKRKAVSTTKKTPVGKVIAALQHLSNCTVPGDYLYQKATNKQRAVIDLELEQVRRFINAISTERQKSMEATP